MVKYVTSTFFCVLTLFFAQNILAGCSTCSGHFHQSRPSSHVNRRRCVLVWPFPRQSTHIPQRRNKTALKERTFLTHSVNRSPFPRQSTHIPPRQQHTKCRPSMHIDAARSMGVLGISFFKKLMSHGSCSAKLLPAYYVFPSHPNANHS